MGLGVFVGHSSDSVGRNGFACRRAGRDDDDPENGRLSPRLLVEDGPRCSRSPSRNARTPTPVVRTLGVLQRTQHSAHNAAAWPLCKEAKAFAQCYKLRAYSGLPSGGAHRPRLLVAAHQLADADGRTDDCQLQGTP